MLCYVMLCNNDLVVNIVLCASCRRDYLKSLLQKMAGIPRVGAVILAMTLVTWSTSATADALTIAREYSNINLAFLPSCHKRKINGAKTKEQNSIAKHRNAAE